MQRRNLFQVVLATAGLAAFGKQAAAAAPSGPSKVAYHLSDLDKVVFVLGNIENHIAGMGGADKVAIVLVVHGPALKAFHAASATPDVSAALAGLSKAGVAYQACANTMRGQKVTLAGLLPGFAVAENGGVVRLAELQVQGYAYLRP